MPQNELRKKAIEDVYKAVDLFKRSNFPRMERKTVRETYLCVDSLERLKKGMWLDTDKEEALLPADGKENEDGSGLRLELFRQRGLLCKHIDKMIFSSKGRMGFLHHDTEDLFNRVLHFINILGKNYGDAIANEEAT